MKGPGLSEFQGGHVCDLFICLQQLIIYQPLPQKFFVNDQYWDRPDGPVFLYIGGEGPLSEIDVLAGMAL